MLEKKHCCEAPVPLFQHSAKRLILCSAHHPLQRWWIVMSDLSREPLVVRLERQLEAEAPQVSE
jgi:hypothetical protein